MPNTRQCLPAVTQVTALTLARQMCCCCCCCPSATPHRSGKFDMTDISMTDISTQQLLLDAMQPPFRDCTGRGIAAGPGAGILYRAYGSADDTAGRELRFRQAMTAEIYGPIGDDPYVYDSGELHMVVSGCAVCASCKQPGKASHHDILQWLRGPAVTSTASLSNPMPWQRSSQSPLLGVEHAPHQAMHVDLMLAHAAHVCCFTCRLVVRLPPAARVPRELQRR
jgi:hypothetical protein